MYPGADASTIGGGSGGGFTIGGAVFEDAADPLMSGVDDVTVTVRRVGGRGAFSTTTNPLGLWRIDEVPEGTYTVSFRPAVLQRLSNDFRTRCIIEQACHAREMVLNAIVAIIQ